MFAKSFTYAGLASSAAAHILMSFPPSYPLMGGVINAPLAGESGAPFPCGTTSFGGVQSTVFEAGSTQNLKFQGTVVHGGGSCQFSVTTDLNPTASSTWKVIKSIEGGCPHRTHTGNLEPADNMYQLPEGYDVEIPDLPVGSYTFAWTWFNKIGNREMYMSCAPVEIMGGTGSVDPSSLPDMLVANVPGYDCKTPDSTDLLFPNPGSNVEKLGAGASYASPVGSACGGGAAPPAPVLNPVTPAPNPVTPPVQPPAPVAPAPVAPAPVAPAPPSGACTEGNFKCIDGATYSVCAGGAWSVTMMVAPGTSCTVGESASLSIV